MSEKRILLIGGVSLIKGRVKEAGPVMKEICDELEPLLQDIGFVDSAPFKTVSMIIRFGEKTDLTPEYEAINKRYNELPVAVEMELAEFRVASKDVVKSAFVKATIDVLLDIAKKYDLPSEPFEMIKS
ncbi:Imm39 family immunity protein [Alteromonas sp. OM2203]|uniref:Imm39 family immunity protein n=1 Tax=Alteromonas sp. OM2203 TaxID=3398817 RepID=UPI003AF3EEA7